MGSRAEDMIAAKGSETIDNAAKTIADAIKEAGNQLSTTTDATAKKVAKKGKAAATDAAKSIGDAFIKQLSKSLEESSSSLEKMVGKSGIETLLNYSKRHSAGKVNVFNAELTKALSGKVNINSLVSGKSVKGNTLSVMLAGLLNKGAEIDLGSIAKMDNGKEYIDALIHQMSAYSTATAKGEKVTGVPSFNKTLLGSIENKDYINKFISAGIALQTAVVEQTQVAEEVTKQANAVSKEAKNVKENIKKDSSLNQKDSNPPPVEGENKKLTRQEKVGTLLNKRISELDAFKDKHLAVFFDAESEKYTQQFEKIYQGYVSLRDKLAGDKAPSTDFINNIAKEAQELDRIIPSMHKWFVNAMPSENALKMAELANKLSKTNETLSNSQTQAGDVAIKVAEEEIQKEKELTEATKETTKAVKEQAEAKKKQKEVQSETKKESTKSSRKKKDEQAEAVKETTKAVKTQTVNEGLSREALVAQEKEISDYYKAVQKANEEIAKLSSSAEQSIIGKNTTVEQQNQVLAIKEQLQRDWAALKISPISTDTITKVNQDLANQKTVIASLTAEAKNYDSSIKELGKNLNQLRTGLDSTSIKNASYITPDLQKEYDDLYKNLDDLKAKLSDGSLTESQFKQLKQDVDSASTAFVELAKKTQIAKDQAIESAKAEAEAAKVKARADAEAAKEKERAEAEARKAQEKADAEAARQAKAAAAEAKRQAEKEAREQQKRAKEAANEAKRQAAEEKKQAEKAAKEAEREAKRQEAEAKKQAEKQEREAQRRAEEANKKAAKAEAAAEKAAQKAERETRKYGQTYGTISPLDQKGLLLKRDQRLADLGYTQEAGYSILKQSVTTDLTDGWRTLTTQVLSATGAITTFYSSVNTQTGEYKEKMERDTLATEQYIKAVKDAGDESQKTQVALESAKRDFNLFTDDDQDKLRHYTAQYAELNKQLSDTSQSEADINKTRMALERLRKTISQLGSKGYRDTWGIFSGFKDIGKYAATLFSVGRIMTAVRRQVSDGWRQFVEYDKALTNISYTMDLPQKSLRNLGQAAIDTAKAMKISVADVTSVLQVYANMNTTTEEMLETAKPTLMLANAAGTNASQAADQIQSVLQQFDLASEQSEHIVDVYEYISAQLKLDFATGIEDMAQSVKTAGSVAKDAGMTFEQLAAITGKVAEKTREDGSAIGNALKTIIVRTSKASKLSGTDAVSNEDISNAAKSLHDVGVEVYTAEGEFRNFTTIMGELAEKWDTLTDAQQNNIAFNVAATRQTNKFRAILQAFTGSMELAATATSEVAGTADEVQGKYEESITARLQGLKNELTDLWVNFFNSDATKGVLDFFQQLLSVINNLSQAAGGLGSIPTALGLIGVAGLTKSGFKGNNIFSYAKGLFNGGTTSLITDYERQLTTFFTNVGKEGPEAAQAVANAVDVMGARFGMSEQRLGELNTEFVASGKSAEQFAAQTARSSLTVSGAVTKTLKNIGGALVNMVASTAVLFVINAAITALVPLVEDLWHAFTTSEAERDLELVSERLEKNVEKLEDANAELETANKRIEELSSKKNLSIVEEDELNRLKRSNDYLKEHIQYLKERNAILRGYGIEDAISAYGEAYDLYKRVQRDELTWDDKTGRSSLSYFGSGEFNVKSAEAQFKNSFDKIKEYAEQFGIIDSSGNLAMEIEVLLNDPNALKLFQMYTEGVEIELRETPKKGRALGDQYAISNAFLLTGKSTEYLQELEDSLERGVDEYSTTLARIFQEDLADALYGKGITEKEFDTYIRNRLFGTTDNIDVIREQLVERLSNSMQASRAEVTEYVTGLTEDGLYALRDLAQTEFDFATTTIDELRNRLEDPVGKIAEKYNDAFNKIGGDSGFLATLTAATTALNDGATLSKEQVDALSTSVFDLSGAIEFVGDKYALNSEKVAQLTHDQANLYRAEIKNAKIDIAGRYAQRIATLTRLRSNYANLTKEQKVELDTALRELTQLGETYTAYQLLEQQILGATNALTRFKQASSGAQLTDNRDTIVEAINTVWDAMENGQLGNTASEAALQLIMPEDLYQQVVDAGTLEEQLKLVQDYLNETFGKYFQIDPETGKATVEGLQTFVKDSIEKGLLVDNGNGTWDIGEGIKIDDFVEKLGIGREAVFSLLQALEATRAGQQFHFEDELDGIDKLMYAQKQYVEIQKEIVESGHPTLKQLEDSAYWADQMKDALIEAKDNGDLQVLIDTYGADEAKAIIDELSKPIVTTYTIELAQKEQQLSTIHEQQEALTHGGDGFTSVGELQQYIELQSNADSIQLEIDALKSQLEGLGEIRVQFNLDPQPIIDATTSDEKLQEALNTEHKAEIEVDKEPVDLATKAVQFLSGALGGAINWAGRLGDALKRLPSPEELTTSQLVTALDGVGNSAGWAKSKVDKLIEALRHIPALSNLGTPTNYHGTASFANGTIGAKRTEMSLVGELGPEMLVRGDKWQIVGQNGAEFFPVKKHDIIFNAGQTAMLLSSGAVSSRGYALGTTGQSFVTGTGDMPIPTVKRADADKYYKAAEDAADKASDAASDAADSISDSADEVADEVKSVLDNLVDWIEVKLDRMQRQTQSWLDTAEEAVDYSNKANNYSEAITAMLEEMSVNQQAKNYYQNYADSLGLDPAYVKKVQDGTIELEKIEDEQLKDLIDSYKELYEKSLGCADTMQSLRGQIRETATTLMQLPLDRASENIEKVNDSIALLDKQLDNAVGAQSKNLILQQKIDKQLEITAENQEAYSKALANLTTVTQNARSVLGGNVDTSRKIDTTGLSGDALAAAEAFNAAFDAYYTASNNYAQSVQDSVTVTRENTKTMFDNIKGDVDQLNGLSDAFVSRFERGVEVIESSGDTAGRDWYEAQIRLKESEQQRLREVNEELQKAMDEAVASGKIEAFSDEWYEMAEAILANQDAVDQYQSAINGLIQSVNKIKWHIQDLKNNAYADLNDEAQLYIDIMSSKKMVDAVGNYTEQGITTAGLLSQQMALARQQAVDYENLLAEIDAEAARNGANVEGAAGYEAYIKERQDALSAYRSSVRDVFNYEQSMMDLVQKKVDAMVDSYSTLIDKKKKALDKTREEAQYMKTMREQSDQVSLLERQLTALAGNNSDYAMKRRKEIQAQLKDAKNTLQETQEDRAYTIATETLSSDLDAYKQQMTQYVEDQKTAFNDLVGSINTNASTVASTIYKTAADSSLLLSQDMQRIWSISKESIDQNGKPIKDYWVDVKNKVGDYNTMIKIVSEQDLTTHVSKTGQSITTEKGYWDGLVTSVGGYDKAVQDATGKVTGYLTEEGKVGSGIATAMPTLLANVATIGGAYDELAQKIEAATKDRTFTITQQNVTVIKSAGEEKAKEIANPDGSRTPGAGKVPAKGSSGSKSPSGQTQKQNETEWKKQINALYQKHLYRNAESAGLNSWLAVMKSGKSISDVEKGILGSKEYGDLQRIKNQTASWYKQYLEREASSDDLARWMKAIQDNSTFFNNRDKALAHIKSGILNSSERDNLIKSKINSYYKKYLGRAADSAGLNAWLAAFKRGESLANIERDIMNSPEAIGRRAKGYATGVKGIGKGQFAWTQEEGLEAIFTKKGILTPLAQGDSVLSARETKNLFNWASMNPTDFINGIIGNATRIHEVGSTPTTVVIENNAPMVKVDGIATDTIVGKMSSMVDTKINDMGHQMLSAIKSNTRRK